MRDLHASLPRPAADDDLSARIRQAAHLTGEFLLRSGETATQFLDEYRFAADPALLDAAARAMVPLIPPTTEVLAGLELGGVPVATALSLHTGLPIAFIRKKAKIHGTCRLAEGADITAKHVLIIDAVVNTGGQIALSAADLRPLGATITHALCVIDRGRSGRTTLATHGVELLNLLELT